MLRRTIPHPAHPNDPFTSSLSLSSINSVAGSTKIPSNTSSNTSTNNTATDEEAANSSSNNDPSNEKFSLFSKLKKSKKDKKPKPVVPKRKASPEEIRAFFTTLLTEHDKQFADDVEKCEAIVSAWKIGGGVEMRQYGPAMYLELFGREYGWILYREVRMSIRNESNILLRRPLYTFLIFSFLLEVLTISLLVHVEMEEGAEVVIILASVAGFLTLFVSLIVLCAGNSPAKIIERDLRACSKAMAGVLI